MDRFPITNRQYIAYLDALVAEGQTDEALRRAPRYTAGAIIYHFDGTHFRCQPDAEGDVWLDDYPVTMIDWPTAVAYMAWRRQTTGKAWRLPLSAEWEKAARGVDGRYFPWGDRFEPAFARVRDSQSDRVMPAVVDSFPVDVSPYGVRGTAGNVEDWCSDGWSPGEQERPPRPVLPGMVAIKRGGGYMCGPRAVRTARVAWAYPELRSFEVGMRGVCPVGPDGRLQRAEG